jgi:hypothetical protein
MPKPFYSETIPTYIKGIPCLIGVINYHVVPPYQGSVYNCPSDLDWYGYKEMEYDILDRKGYLASWLEKKATDADRDRIEEEISDYFTAQKDNLY